ncbi:putative F-box/kelch-repeat protein [Raphanus sativus]|nr:putative F-box/kelch-repeat protein [Raphanus sativus]
MVPVSVLNAPPVDWTTLVAVGPYIYAICGHIEKAPCSNVPFLDCRTHTWLEAPSLRLAYTDSEHDGKMYLAGIGENPTSLNCIEVFNTTTRTWKPVPPGKRELHGRDMEGKMIVASVNRTTGEKGLAFKPKEKTGELLGSNTDWDSPCMIENIAYYYRSSGEFEWFDTKNDSFLGKLRGLERLPKFAGYSCVKLVEHGGKMLVLWDMYVPASGFKELIIWCAEIKLERRSCEEIRGEVEWFDAVLKVPKSYEFMYAISSTV